MSWSLIFFLWEQDAYKFIIVIDIKKVTKMKKKLKMFNVLKKELILCSLFELILCSLFLFIQISNKFYKKRRSFIARCSLMGYMYIFRFRTLLKKI